MNGYTRFPLKTKLEMMKMYTEKSISVSVIAKKFNVRNDTLNPNNLLIILISCLAKLI